MTYNQLSIDAKAFISLEGKYGDVFITGFLQDVDLWKETGELDDEKYERAHDKILILAKNAINKATGVILKGETE